MCPAQTPARSYSIIDSPFLFRNGKTGTDSFIDSMSSTVLISEYICICICIYTYMYTKIYIHIFVYI